MLAALPAILIEKGIFEEFSRFIPQYFPSSILITTLSISLSTAFVEEFLKYLVVREKVLNNPEFDEPIDTMLYMIISALGFAAFENVLILLSLGPTFLIKEAITISALRFLGATLLHALCSGLVGYFLALSFFRTKLRGKLVFLGLGIATPLHSFFNLSIIKIGESLAVENGRTLITNFPLFILSVTILISILFFLILFVTFGSRGLKKIASVCEIK